MLNKSEIEQIKLLNEAGHSPADISRATRRTVVTIYKYLKLLEKNPFFLSSPKNERDGYLPEKIKPYEYLIREKIKKGRINGTKIFNELKNEGYKGSYSLVNKYLGEEKTKRQEVKTYRKVETGPGEQAQIDWAHFGQITIDKRRYNLYVFIYVLSYSRAMYAEFVTSQRQQIFQNCHINAFLKLGVPKKLRYDNVKTVVISRQKFQDKEERIIYNFDFLNFANYYKFSPEVCPRYYPRSKGKVESGVKYLRYHFMDGEVYRKTFDSIDELNKKLWKWLDTEANVREHATTREKPLERWEKEKESLFIVENYPKYVNTCSHSRRCSGSSMVTYDKSSYWIPTEYANKKINVVENNLSGITNLEFYFKGQKIMEHHKSLVLGGWAGPEDHMLSKKRKSVEERVKENPIYKMEVEVRDLNYYNKFIK